jgi:hypothetical protein
MVSRVFRVIVFLAAVCTFSATALALVFSSSSGYSQAGWCSISDRQAAKTLCADRRIFVQSQ